MTDLMKKIATTTVTVAALALAGASAAQADTTPHTAQTLRSAHTTAASRAGLESVARFFAHYGNTTAAAAGPHIEGSAVTVNGLNPDFVKGHANAPVALPEFTASKAVAADGKTASVWTAQTPDGWKVVNIASGSEETDYAAKGAEAAPGGTVFQEPQINGWYVLSGGRVLPLNQEARKSVGSAEGVTVAAYQKLVHRRYADKLPGSAYDRKGMAGGFGTKAAPVTATTHQHSSVAAQSGPGTPGTLALAGAGALLVIAGGYGVRRRAGRARTGTADGS
ncbi:hypothetical protein [Streptomyces sp. NPDC059398]|uniref:hypothetical protein n=1 Tax=Streptomyces sp. NPDC059398 TaxID=3346820 RepID=UPI0036969E65